MLTTCSTSRLAKSQQNGRSDAPLANMRAVASGLDFAQTVARWSHFLATPVSQTILS
jgi:hypothetical protein